MSKGPSTFKKTDAKRKIEAAELAGIRVGRIELQAGRVIIIPRTEDESEIQTGPAKEIIL